MSPLSLPSDGVALAEGAVAVFDDDGGAACACAVGDGISVLGDPLPAEGLDMDGEELAGTVRAAEELDAAGNAEDVLWGA